MSVKNFCKGLLAAGTLEWELSKVCIDPCPTIPYLSPLSPLRIMATAYFVSKELDKEEKIARICRACEMRNKQDGCACTHAQQYDKCELLQELV